MEAHSAAHNGVKHPQNIRKHILRTTQYIMIPVTQDAPPVMLKPGIAAGIGCRAVLPAINFNDEPLFNTSKISDERPDWVLPAESATGQLALAKSPP